MRIEIHVLQNFAPSNLNRDDTGSPKDAEFGHTPTNHAALNAVKAVLNEKDPPAPTVAVSAPPSLRYRIVSEHVHKIRSHPDFRTARRALIISRLAQVIAERKVQGGLRRVLLTQAKRLEWLADRRYIALGGAASVEVDTGDGED